MLQHHVVAKCVRLLSSSIFLAVSIVSCGSARGQYTTLPSKPDIVLEGDVAYRNRQSYLELPFAVPSDVKRLSVELAYTGRDKHTNIDLGVFDTERFRGWSGGNKDFFTISETDATPSYLPGTLPAGPWKLILGIPNIEQGVTSHYIAKITFVHAVDPPLASTFSRAPLRSGPGWYRGDLHMHDAHSDGSCKSQSGKKVPCPLYKSVEDAVARKLDFIAITDHNTTSHFNDVRELQPYFDQLLFIPGREITTFDGHANVFGTTEFIDFRLTSPHVPDMEQLLKDVQKKHGLLSLNHPGLPSGAACMGCGWTVPNTDYSLIPAIEAVNGGTLDGPGSGIPFWEDKLNKGYRITAIAGSDNHNADASPDTASAIGHPTTVVFAENLSEQAVLNGIRAGHVFIDLEGTHDRSVEFTAEADGKRVMMGDTLSSPTGKPIRFHVHLANTPGATLELIMDDAPNHLLDQIGAGKSADDRNFEISADGKHHWLCVMVRSLAGRLLLMTNPIYLNP